VASEAGSAVEAADQAKVWSLEIRHEFTLDVEGSISTHLRLWTGQFTLEEETITGSGTGAISDLNLTCPIADRTKFSIEGSFGFDISGKLTTAEDGSPAFALETTANNLKMTKTLDLASCNSFIAVVQDLSRTIIEEVPLLLADTLEVAAEDGATAVFELDGAPYNNENSIYFTSPMDVTVRSGQMLEPDE
jgi:hypothetical protein